jgi:hypothetical protein
MEVFVRPFRGGGGRWQVSTNGGSEPVFARSGKTLYYRGDNHIVAATYSGGSAFTVTGRHNVADDRFAAESGTNFDVFPDGKRLVVIEPADQGTQVIVVVNWIEELKRRLGVAK